MLQAFLLKYSLSMSPTSWMSGYVFHMLFLCFEPLHWQPLQVYSPPFENVCFLCCWCWTIFLGHQWLSTNEMQSQYWQFLLHLYWCSWDSEPMQSHIYVVALTSWQLWYPRKIPPGNVTCGLGYSLLGWLSIIGQKESYANCDSVLITAPHCTSCQPICSFHFLCDHILVFIPPSHHSDSYHWLRSFMQGTGEML